MTKLTDAYLQLPISEALRTREVCEIAKHASRKFAASHLANCSTRLQTSLNVIK
jgi:hypothetical protein